MSNKNPSVSTRFQKGNPGGGRRKGTIRTDDVKAVIGKFWRMTKAQLKAKLEDEKTPIGELMVASIMAKTIKDGDATRLSTLLDRAIGRVKLEEIDDTAEPFVIHMMGGEQMVLGSKKKGA